MTKAPLWGLFLGKWGSLFPQIKLMDIIAYEEGRLPVFLITPDSKLQMLNSL